MPSLPKIASHEETSSTACVAGSGHSAGLDQLFAELLALAPRPLRLKESLADRVPSSAVLHAGNAAYYQKILDDVV